ncbi:MAG: radical SAM protein [Deltaproteobacteria bacterium]|nr:radical SAM protein [Deltaproteobacteria bacterium]
MESNQQKNIENNRLEYGEAYDTLTFIGVEQAREAEKIRDELIGALAGNVTWGFNRTKLNCQNLSNGCRLCGEGTWSCLFINGICNARCFYCPTEQPSKSEPMTNSIPFGTPRDYVDYIRLFKFRGVSISGGEPLLTFQRTFRYISEIKKAFGDNIYLWLYTNGILADRENLSRLKAAGLDEIRFDLSACRYQLDKVKIAVDIIPVVAVEIPAIPEDEALLKTVIERIQRLGVSHLNLHQLRCTPYNRKNLVQRGYTFLHGPKVTVLESELCALRTIRFVYENNIELHINYCSFVYKHRYQRAGYRRRLAPFYLKPYETITETGMIRKLSVKGTSEEMIAAARRFESSGSPKYHWELTNAQTRLYFHDSLWRHINFATTPLFVSYFEPHLRPSLSFRNAFREIRLNSKKPVYIEKPGVLLDKELKGETAHWFIKQFIQKQIDLTSNETGTAEINELENIKSRLQDYY